MARKVTERCQRLAQKQAIAHAQSPHGQHITVGVGVGTAMAGGLESMTPSDFIDAVDWQLYAAKRNGRNRMETVQVG